MCVASMATLDGKAITTMDTLETNIEMWTSSSSPMKGQLTMDRCYYINSVHVAKRI